MVNPKEAKEVLEKQYKRQNDYIKRNYHRATTTMPNELYEKILEVYGKDVKVNGYIIRLIEEDLKSHQEPEHDQPEQDDFLKAIDDYNRNQNK